MTISRLTGFASLAAHSTLSIAANRISYLLDLRGPSVAVDTACSSALFALDGVVSVFMVDDFVTVTKAPEAEWAELVPEVTAAIEQSMA